MTLHYVAVKTKDGYKHFEVPEEVATYIKQLECYVMYPNQSKLKERYPERFKPVTMQDYIDSELYNEDGTMKED